MNNRFLQALNEQKRRTQRHHPEIFGTLGIVNGGQQVVEVPDRASYVYVQVRSTSYEVIEAFNSKVSPVYGLPVIIIWQGNRYVVLDRDTMRYSNWIDSSAYLPRHASTHEFEGSAGDVVFSSLEQFLPLLPMPSGSSGNKQIVVGHYNLMSTGGTFSYFPTQPTVDLTPWNPTSPTGAVMVLVSVDAGNGSLHYDVGSGSVFGYWLTGTADVLPFVPKVSDMNRYLPVAGVRLISGTTTLTWDNIYDIRPLFGVIRGVAGGGGGGSFSSSSGLAVLNNGLLENYANQLNLLGSNFTLTHSGTEAELTILGGGGASGSLLLDTSNGPLFGALVVYKKNPNLLNQYFDQSVIVGYQSGTNGLSFSAAGEFVNWSTGSVHYGVYIDDEGSGLGLLVGANNAMDKGPMVEFDHFINSARNGGRYFQPMVQWTRNGGGFPNPAHYIAPMLVMNENDPDNTRTPTIQIQAGFTPITDIYPLMTGTPWSNYYPFPQEAGAYGWDTHNDLLALITGTVHSYWSNGGTVIAWLNPEGRMVLNQLMIREYPFGATVKPVSGSFSQGQVALKNGTATIPTTAVTMSSRIYLTTQFGSGSHVGYNYVYSRMAGSGFTIRSSDLLDTSLVAWLLVEPI